MTDWDKLYEILLSLWLGLLKISKMQPPEEGKGRVPNKKANYPHLVDKRLTNPSLDTFLSITEHNAFSSNKFSYKD